MTTNGLPVLSSGAHLAPEDGACLMEYVSVVAGERFTDAPRCTDPMLALLARLVNDATSDGGRGRLGSLAPALAAAPRTDALGSAELVLSTVLRVQAAVEGPRRLDRHVRGARRHLHRTIARVQAGRRVGWSELLHRRGSGRHRLVSAVDATSALPEPVRDAVLHAVLASALVHHRAAAPPREHTVANAFPALFTGDL
jgi:hypothetical protein